MRLDRRVPEPELMESPEQAAAYSAADFAAAHDAVVDQLLARRPSVPVEARRVIDLGCGPADVTARLAQALPQARVVGVDAGPRMLALGRQRLERLGLEGRVELRALHLPAEPEDLVDLGQFDLVASNSLLHHLEDPAALWATVAAVGAVDALVHVVDLLRPADDEEVDRLVAVHARGEPEVLVDDFRSSLRAAYRPDEVVEQLRAAGLETRLAVEVVSDRHLLVHGRLRSSS
jgi:SAM-dependent methyltransferase